MRRHRYGQVAQRAKGREVMRFQLGQRRIDHRRRKVAVRHRAPMAGDVLHHGQNAAGEQAFGYRAAKLDHGFGLFGVGPVADNVVRAGNRNVEHRRAGGVEAEFMEIVRHRLRAEIRGVFCLLAVIAPQFREGARAQGSAANAAPSAAERGRPPDRP